MDWLDKISIAIITVLIISSVALISGHMGAADLDPGLQRRTPVADRPSADGEMENTVRVIKNFIEINNLEKAEILTHELINKYPYEGEPRMLMGDIFMRRQEPLKAVPEYKEAINLNPDYLDKKTPLFQGKKLKVALSEALAEIENAVRLNANSASMNSDKKNIYYLQRRIAGSCS